MSEKDLLELLFAARKVAELFEERILNSVTDEHAYVEVYQPALERLQKALKGFELDK